MKINVRNGEIYRNVVKLLRDGGYSYHSYENKQTRPIKVMAKKLHYTCNPESIVEDLHKRGYKIMEVT